MTTIACSGCATLEILAASGLSYVITGKSLTDNVVSVAINEDCAMHRLLQNKQMCQPEDTEEQTASPDLVAKQSSLASDDSAENKAQSPTDNSLDEPLEEAETTGPEMYAVVGSFNNYQFAVERLQKYQAFDVQIVTASGGNIAYRVVVGPLSSLDELQQLPSKVGTELANPWVINLCANGIEVGACEAGLLAKNTVIN